MPVKLQMPSISYVVARSVPGNVIGCDDKLPWHLKTDLRHFKAVTDGHVVIMGRKTFDSIGRPLPNRINIIISSQPTSSSGNVHIVGRREEALFLADHFSIKHGLGDIFVIGGGSIYTQFNELFNKIYLTEVYAENIRGDAFFEYKFDMRKWDLADEQNYPASDIDEFPFAIKTLKKRRPKSRSRLLAKFMKDDPALTDWEARQIVQMKKIATKAA